MRFAYSSSSSEASADEGEATFVGRDLRTRAGRLGVAPPSTSIQSATAPQQQLPPRASTSKSVVQPPAARNRPLPPWIKASPEQRRGGAALGSSSESSGSEDESTRRRRRRTPTAQRHRTPARTVSATSSSSSQLSTDSDDSDDGVVSPAQLRHRRDRRRRTRRLSGEGDDGKDDDSDVGNEAIRSIRLAGDEEEWEGEWGDVLRKSSTRWGSIMSRRSQTPGGRASLSPMASRKSAAPATAKPSASADPAGGLDADLSAVLSRLRIEKEEAEKRTRQDFESRQKRLWEGIETAIRSAEEEAQRKAKEEAERRAREEKERQEEERKAKEQREAAEAKQRQEKEAKDQEAKRSKEEQDRQAREAAEQETRLKKAAADAAALKGMAGGDALLLAARQDWQRWRAEMTRIKTEVLPVVKGNAAWRKSCFAAKRQITPKVGQLTNSRSEIDRIAQALGGLLNEAKQAPGCEKGEIYEWVLNHLAKCLIRQAEQEVAVKLDTAYPLARLVLRIMVAGRHSEGLGKVLMARLVKKSPWILGYVPTRGEAASEEPEVLAKLVGRSSPDETSVQFTSRQSGIVAFYFALCQTDLVDCVANPNGDDLKQAATLVPVHFRPSALWHWSARCSTPPMTSNALVAPLWCTLLEVASPVLTARYPNQMAKLLRMLLRDGVRGQKAGFMKLEEATSAAGRLRLLLEEWEKEGRVSGAGKGRAVGA